MARRMSKEEKEWQAESDARTITRYGEIMNDTDRLDAAKNHIAKEAEKAAAALKAMQDYK